MAHNSDYSHIYAQADNGLSVEEVCRAIGDRVDICNSPRINKWAKKKPQEVANFYGVLTDILRRNNKWGFNLDSCIDDSPNGIFVKAAANNYVWPYIRRTVSRLLDFDGYHKNAVAPYTYSPEASFTSGGEYDIECTLQPLSEFRISDFDLEESYTWRIGFLYKRNNVYYISLGVESPSGLWTAKIDFGHDIESHIEGLWVMTTASASGVVGDDVHFLYLDSSHRNYHVTQDPSTNAFRVVNDLVRGGSPAFWYSGTDVDVRSISVRFEVQNMLESEYAQDYEIILTVIDIANEETYTGTYQGTIQPSTNANPVLNVSIVGDEEHNINDLYVRCEYRYTDSGEESWTTRYTFFAVNQVDAHTSPVQFEEQKFSDLL